MKMDVIIPVYKPTEKLERLLVAITKQTCLPEHIFLLHTKDGKSLAWTKKVCRDIAVEEIMIEKDAFDHGGTRQMGAEKSKAEIMVFLTQDAIPESEYVFEHLVNVLEQENDVAVAYARQIAGKEGGIVEQYTRHFNYPKTGQRKTKKDLEKLGIKTYFCSNVCAAYRKDIFTELGGFEEPIIFNEDMIYAAKAIHAGYQIAYEEKAIVEHTHAYTGKQLLKRNFDMGVSQACYPEIFSCVKSESEGLRLLRETTAYLVRKRRYEQLFVLGWQSSCKYIGYLLGKNYKKLPRHLVKRMTMNPGYWKKREAR